MSSILIVAEQSKEVKELAQGLSGAGLNFTIIPPEADIIAEISKNTPDLVILEISEVMSLRRVQDYSEEIKQKMSFPVMMLVPRRLLFNMTPGLASDDFIVTPCDEREFVLRVRRLLHKNGNSGSGEVVKGGELAVDTAKAEVTLGGQRLDITFREYELLRFLMSNKGRVFTREALLNKVWGFDYFGGDRTVDVHIRRLRSKIEVNGTIYIETVRNIGYRFKENL